MCALGILLFITKDFVLISVGRFITGVFGSFITPILWAFGSIIANVFSCHGKVMSSLNLITNVSMIIAFALSGFVITTFGYLGTFILLSIIMLLIPLMVYSLLRYEVHMRITAQKPSLSTLGFI